MAVGGNIEAIRDWTNRFFYTKEEIAELFINGTVDTNKADIFSIAPISIINGRYVKSATNTLRNSFLFKTQLNGTDAVDPFNNDPTNFKISIKFKVLSKKSTGNQVLVSGLNDFQDIPSIVYFNNGNESVAVSWRYDGETTENLMHITNSPLVIGNTYRADLTCNNSVLVLSLYSASNDLIGTEQTQLTKNIKYSNSEVYAFGNTADSSNYSYANGLEFDLYNSYIISNGSIFWGNDYMNRENLI